MWQKMMENSITDMINNFIVSILSMVSDPYIIEGVMDKYKISVIIGNSLLGLSLVYAVIVYKYSLDMFETSKVKRIIQDLMVAGFMLNFGDYFIKKGNEFAEILATGWYGTPEYIEGIGKTILESIGIAAVLSGGSPIILPTLGIAILILLGVVLILLIILILTSIIIASVLEIMFIMLPVILGLYPTKLGKKFMEKWTTLYVGMLSIPPVQGLALSLLFTSHSSEVTFLSSLICLGRLIVVVLVVPGLMLYMFSIASSITTN